MFGGGGGLTGGTALERRLDRITVVTAVVFGSARSGSPGSGIRETLEAARARC